MRETVLDLGSTSVYPVTTPTSDPSPDYTFSSTEAGTITLG